MAQPTLAPAHNPIKPIAFTPAPAHSTPPPRAPETAPILRSVPMPGARATARRAEPTPSPAETEPIKVPLVSVARNWPDPMRREILATYLAASIAIPFSELETAMKRGKAAFSWKQIRLWLIPKPSTTFEEHDAVSLELPLSVLAPLFMARRINKPSVKRLEGQEEIPDVFIARKPEPAGGSTEFTAAVAEPTEPPAVPRASALEKGATEPKSDGPGPAPSNGPQPLDNLTLARSSALPTEVVQKACHLKGVAGALLTTLDGLNIASQLPPGLKPELAAGFLPQIFTRLSQYTRELKLGDPNHVEMLVGQVPLQIIRTPGTYFAVLGKSSEPLPKLQLIALANQLSQPTH